MMQKQLQWNSEGSSWLTTLLQGSHILGGGDNEIRRLLTEYDVKCCPLNYPKNAFVFYYGYVHNLHRKCQT